MEWISDIYTSLCQISLAWLRKVISYFHETEKED
jgi:hypothetical protein